MATKKRDIHIQDDTDRSFWIWTDLTEEDIVGVEGVFRAFQTPSRPLEFRVSCDPRYDIEEIKAEVAELAEAKASE